MDLKDMNIDLDKISMPRMVTNPPLPNIVYTKMAEAEKHEEIVENLTKNYNQLLEITKIKEKELEEAKTEVEKAKKYNKKMMIIAVISMIAAIISMIAGIAIPIITGGTA